MLNKWRIGYRFYAKTVMLAGVLIFALGNASSAMAQLEGLEATLFKSPTCGCCEGYVAFLEEKGVKVAVIDTGDVSAVKLENGVPYQAWSCHTVIMDGYVIEGHVPLEALTKLLTERPEIDGIALPGMPAGSPGMSGVKASPFEVIEFDEGELKPFLSL